MDSKDAKQDLLAFHVSEIVVVRLNITANDIGLKQITFFMHTECEVLALGRIRENPYASTAYQTLTYQTVGESIEKAKLSNTLTFLL